ARRLRRTSPRLRHRRSPPHLHHSPQTRAHRRHRLNRPKNPSDWLAHSPPNPWPTPVRLRARRPRVSTPLWDERPARVVGGGGKSYGRLVPVCVSPMPCRRAIPLRSKGARRVIRVTPRLQHFPSPTTLRCFAEVYSGLQKE